MLLEITPPLEWEECVTPSVSLLGVVSQMLIMLILF